MTSERLGESFMVYVSGYESFGQLETFGRYFRRVFGDDVYYYWYARYEDVPSLANLFAECEEDFDHNQVEDDDFYDREYDEWRRNSDVPFLMNDDNNFNTVFVEDLPHSFGIEYLHDGYPEEQFSDGYADYEGDYDADENEFPCVEDWADEDGWESSDDLFAFLDVLWAAWDRSERLPWQGQHVVENFHAAISLVDSRFRMTMTEMFSNPLVWDFFRENVMFRLFEAARAADIAVRDMNVDLPLAAGAASYQGIILVHRANVTMNEVLVSSCFAVFMILVSVLAIYVNKRRAEARRAAIEDIGYAVIPETGDDEESLPELEEGTQLGDDSWPPPDWVVRYDDAGPYAVPREGFVVEEPRNLWERISRFVERECPGLYDNVVTRAYVRISYMRSTGLSIFEALLEYDRQNTLWALNSGNFTIVYLYRMWVICNVLALVWSGYMMYAAVIGLVLLFYEFSLQVPKHFGLISGMTLAVSIIAYSFATPILPMFFFSVFPAVAEESFKRRGVRLFGNWFKWFFAFVEMWLYVSHLGPIMLVPRILVMVLHAIWNDLPVEQGMTLHFIHNALCYVQVLFFMSGSYASVVSDEIVVVILVLVILCCLVFCILDVIISTFVIREEVVIPQAKEPVNPFDFEVKHLNIYVKKSGAKLNKFPPLHVYRGWEKCAKEGIRDMFSRDRDYNPSLVRLHYVEVLRYMQTGSQIKLKSALDLQAQIEMRVVPQSDVDLTRLITMYVKDYDVAAMLLKVVVLIHTRAPVITWISMFWDPRLGCGINLYDLYTTAHEAASPTLEKMGAWLAGEEVESEDGAIIPQSAEDFFESPMYKAFIQVLSSSFLSLVFGDAFPVDLITKVATCKSVIEFFGGLGNLLSMSKQCILTYWKEKRLHEYLGSFTSLEARVDSLLARDHPSPSQKNYDVERKKFIAELDGLAALINEFSRKKPELTSRHRMLLDKIATLRRAVLSPPLQRAAVVMMTYGSAGSGKSSLVREVMDMALTQAGLVPDNYQPSAVTHTLRMTTKHVDALPNPSAIAGVFFDDFQQNKSDVVNLAMEAEMIHIMATEEKVSLPFASIEGKELSNQLSPAVVIANTNNPEIFLATENFNRDSLARRVDILVDFENLTDTPFSATKLPGRYDIKYSFYALKYSGGVPDIQREVLKLDGVHTTNDRVEARKLLVAFIVKTRKDKDLVLKKKTETERCANGLAMSAHDGHSCGPGCSFYEGDSNTATGKPEKTGEIAPNPAQSNERHPVNRRTRPRHNDLPVVEEAGEDEDSDEQSDRSSVSSSSSVIHLQRENPDKVVCKAFLILSVAIGGLYFLWKEILLVVTIAWLLYALLKFTFSMNFIQKSLFVVEASYKVVVPQLVEEVKAASAYYLAGDWHPWEEIRSRTRGHWFRAALEKSIVDNFEAKWTNAILALASVGIAVIAIRKMTPSKREKEIPLAGVMPSGNETLERYAVTRHEQVKSARTKISGRFEDVRNLVEMSTCRVITASGLRPGFAICSGSSAFIPDHMYEEVLNFRLVRQTGDPVKGQQFRMTHTSFSDVTHFGGLDVCRVECSGAHPFKSLQPHAVPMKVAQQTYGRAWLFYYDKETTEHEWIEITAVRPLGPYKFGAGDVNAGFSYTLPTGKRHYKGMCGSPIIMADVRGNGFLLGFHHGGHPTSLVRCFGQYVTADMFEGEEVMISPGPTGELDEVVPEGLPEPWSLPTGSFVSLVKEDGQKFDFDEPLPDLIPTPPQKKTNFLPIAAVNLGSLQRHTGRQRTHLRVSKLAKHFPEGSDKFYGPPSFVDKLNEVTGEYEGPFSALAQCAPKDIRPDMRAAKKAFADLMMDVEILGPHLAEQKPLSLKQAINGIPGVVKSVDVDTSAGFPYRGHKKSEFVTGEAPNKKLDPEFEALIEEFCKNPRKFWVTAEGCLKDEVRPLGKAARLFTCFPFVVLLLFRMFLTAILVVWRYFRQVSETMIGANAAGKDWTVLGTTLDGMEDAAYMAADFKRYDKSFCAEIKELVYIYLMALAAKTSYTKHEQSVLQCLLSSIKCVLLILVNEVFYMNDWEHSGDPMTVEVNTIGQRFLFRYWFFRQVPEAEPGDFRLWVRLFAYGDDSVAAVKKDPRLTQLTLAMACDDWGFEVTSATKGELTEFTPRDQITFLKRGIVYDPLYSGYRAPLEPASIYKMLCWFDEDSALTEDSWCVAVVQNAAAEWFLHGREVFEEKTAYLKQVCSEAGFPYLGLDFESYMERYNRTEFKTWDM